MDSNYQRPTDEVLIKDAISFARNLTRNLHDAEDLAQQAWLKVFNKYGQIENRRILFVAIRNLRYDQLRRQKVVQYTSLENAPEPTLYETFGHESDMQSALQHLSPHERDSIELNVILGYTAREIAHKRGIPRGTILSHLTRARQKLRQIFANEFSQIQLETANSKTFSANRLPQPLRP